MQRQSRAPRTFRDGVYVLQSSLGRLEREEGSQAHHAVEFPDAQHALLNLRHKHTVTPLHKTKTCRI